MAIPSSVDITLPSGVIVNVPSDVTELEISGLGTVTVHENKAAGNLIERWKTKEGFRALHASYAPEIQEVENALWQVLLSMYVDNASGYSLDALGNRVGEHRQSQNDPDYRVRIKARIVINRSEGRPEDLLLVCRVLGVHGRYTNTGNASCRIDIDERPTNGATRRQIHTLLGQTVSGGVRIYVSVPVTTTPMRFGNAGSPGAFNCILQDVVGGAVDAPELCDGRRA